MSFSERIFRAASILLLWGLAAAPPCLPESLLQAETVEENWYRVEIGGVPAGWMRSRETRTDGRLTTETTFHLRVQRGAVEVAMEMAAGAVETADGRLLSAWSEQTVGPVPVETRYDFGEEGIVVTTRQGDQTGEEVRPYPEGEWLSPGAAQTRALELIRSGAEEFTLRTIDPQLGIEPVEIDWRLEERGVEVEALGREFVTSRWRQIASFAPQLASRVHLAADGRLIRSSMPMMGTTLEVTLASRQDVLGERGAPELLVSTLLRPDRPIRDPRGLRRAVYELRTADGSELPELPSAGPQTVVRPADGNGDAARVTVDLDREPADGEGAPDPDVYLRSSFLIDHQNPAVRRLHDRVAPSLGEVAGERAEALRSFVGRHLVDKNLEHLLASAGEVASRRAGDCTEHSVLLAALLRADGIPARVAAGLVYVDQFAGDSQVFGYHMWTQAWIDGRWVDLDASFPSPFDATHVAFVTTALRDHEAALRELAGVTSLLGNLEIRVLEAAVPERRLFPQTEPR